MTKKSMRCRGMHDLLPDDMVRFRHVEEVFSDVCRAWGYEEVRTPTVEQLWLFTTVGTLSPQMLGRVYSFLDWDGWSGERVVLRPDATIPVARLYMEQLAKKKMAKLCYVQNVFRFADGDEPREDWQCGAELIGDTQPQGDVELVLMGLETLAKLNLGPIGLQISHPGILREVLAKAGLDPAEQLEMYDRILNRDTINLSQMKERHPQAASCLELLLGMEGNGIDYISDISSSLLDAIPELLQPLDELKTVADTLSRLGHNCQVVAALSRNFEYYTGPAFHYLIDNVKVGGGGRYDSLVSLMGEESVPASGFALDVSRLTQALSQDEVPICQVIVRPDCAESMVMVAAFRAVATLRREGISAQIGMTAASEVGLYQLIVDGKGYCLQRPGVDDQCLDSVEAVVSVLEDGKCD